MSAETFSHLNTFESWHKLHETTLARYSKPPNMKPRNMVKRLKDLAVQRIESDNRIIFNLMNAVRNNTLHYK